MRSALELPPEVRTETGEPRRVGVEVEFGGMDAARSAQLVQEVYGGRIEQHDPHAFTVKGTPLGDFQVALDSIYAHARQQEDGPLTAQLKDRLAGTVGSAIERWIPCEVVAPPVEIGRLAEIDRLVEALRDHQAAGTRSSILYGFGLQLNVQVASTGAGYLRRHLQAYLVLSPWLRAEIDVDPTRRVLPFIAAFPRAYVLRVTAPDYRPTLEQLIDDYLAANPTRNRELDLLPLFAHIDPERVRRVTSDPHIKARPTFHYRLPNSRVDEPEWGGAIEEWNRWVEVERLAADAARLKDVCDDYRACLGGTSPGDWVEQARRWVGW